MWTDIKPCNHSCAYGSRNRPLEHRTYAYIYEIGVYHESLTIAIYGIRAGYMNTFMCKYGIGVDHEN